jgi:hypothetical protein
VLYEPEKLHVINSADRLSRLLPDDAVKRAQIRFFVEYWSTKVASSQFKLLQTRNDKDARQAVYSEINTALKRVSWTAGCQGAGNLG